MNPWTPEFTFLYSSLGFSLGYYEDLFFNASIVEHCISEPTHLLDVLRVVFSYFRIFTEYVQKYHAVVLNFFLAM